ncbi:molecular chaperone HtpG [Arthrobacter stackebrandtii]|uniref:Molecular chaperone HtpG n=1 Tax=Arthrobacter stackebrandtii TaxID=272161 RepID=A0ABS4YSS7_9MICC|nr:HSP90 family protein [Arthrobacter stackebrandtii]MBP2411849.1 molecular chaperone HtpG [Arthrobacter stackebrandtii]PYG99119.1 HSP90 family protein [Arthrobacter stackebrandtii]
MSNTVGAQSRPFQVDLHGVVDLLSRHIYSGPQVYLRELIQNGRDAIVARRGAEGPDAAGRREIRIFPAGPDNPEFRIDDDGVGLNADEMTELLATVGRSSKRDLFDLPRQDLLGQFGIGLLSCFMVADEITVVSRKEGESAVRWVGSASGTFTVEVLDAVDLPVGTSVKLRPRADDAELCHRTQVTELATRYARYLPVPILVADGTGGFDTINRPPVFAVAGEERAGRRSELMELGTALLGARPLDAVELSSPATGTRGTAFILPFAPPPSARAAHAVHVGGMLVEERCQDLLPEWAFFARAVVDSTGLKPTASRESLVADESLEATREELGAALRAWIMRMGTGSPDKLAAFVAVHHLGLKSLVAHDDDLASFLTRWLSVETTAGRMTIEELVARGKNIRYTDSLEEFRQIAAIVPAESPVVNGGYVYDSEIIRRLPFLFEGTTVEKVELASLLDSLAVPALAERAAVAAFEQRAGAVLAGLDMQVSVRSFAPADVSALYLADDSVLRGMHRNAARRVSNTLWNSVLAKAEKSMDAAAELNSQLARATLCANWDNPLVRTLAQSSDEAVFNRTIKLLYVQSMLAAHLPLGPAQRSLLTESLGDLVQLSLNH